MLTETALGRPMDEALTEMADRLGSENFEFVITAVTIQRQVGGSLASLFDMVAETVRQRQQFARKIRALTAMGRMSAYVLVGLPFFIGARHHADEPVVHASALGDDRRAHADRSSGLGCMAVGGLMPQEDRLVQGVRDAMLLIVLAGGSLARRVFLVGEVVTRRSGASALAARARAATARCARAPREGVGRFRERVARAAAGEGRAA